MNVMLASVRHVITVFSSISSAELLRIIAVIRGLKANSNVANSIRYGTNPRNVACGVESKRIAPPMPPIRLVIPSVNNTTRLSVASSLRYALTLATEPGHNATVLVALAWMGCTPAKIRLGKVRKLPPPATELSAPPSTAAMKRIRPAINVITVLASHHVLHQQHRDLLASEY